MDQSGAGCANRRDHAADEASLGQDKGETRRQGTENQTQGRADLVQSPNPAGYGNEKAKEEAASMAVSSFGYASVKMQAGLAG